MNGVEILSAQEVATEAICNWWLAGFIWIGIVILGGIIGFCVADYVDRGAITMLCCLAGAVVGMFIWCIVCIATTRTVEYETQYKVIISDEVSMNEFLDKYEIIDQEGKIYTVKERE